MERQTEKRMNEERKEHMTILQNKYTCFITKSDSFKDGEKTETSLTDLRENRRLGQQNGSAGKGAWPQACQTEF